MKEIGDANLKSTHPTGQGGPKGGGPVQPGQDVQRPSLHGGGLPAVVVQGGCRGQGRLGPAGGVQGAEEGGGGRRDHHLFEDQTRWLFLEN